MDGSVIQKHILIMITLLCGVISSILFYQAFYDHDRPLQIVFLDVGQGDAALIITPNGRTVVIDTGPKNNLGSLIAPHLPISDRDIDLLILTHPDLDHIGGTLSLLKSYDVQNLMHSGLLAGAEMYDAIAQKISRKHIPTVVGNVGQVIQLDKDVYLEVYSPNPTFESFEPNDYSVVTRLVYKDTSVLLTGDAPTTIEHNISEVYGDQLVSDILKIGHHGSLTSTGDFFLELVQPEYAIISAGCNNRFGHPHPDVLSRLFIHDIEIFDTCDDGDIVFESDGEVWEKI